MPNQTSSSSDGGNLTIQAPHHSHASNSSDSDSSEDHDHHGHHDWHNWNAKQPTPQVSGAAPDNDGMEQSRLTGLVAGIAIVVAILLLICMVRRRLRRQTTFAPTPSLILDVHHRLESPEPTMVRPLAFNLPGKRRGSLTTTSASDLTARSSVSTVVAVRRFSKGSSTGSVNDGGVVTSACVDPVITAARIPLSDITLHDMVGRGAFGEVFRGTYDDRIVAVKRIVPDRRTDLVYIEGLLSEAKFLARLTHPHIVRFIGVAWDALSDLCVVSEFLEGGDLRSRLHRFEVEHRPKGFDAEKVRIALHVAHAMAYLHSLSPVVLHRDLKSRNILLDKHHNAKLADFGVARERIDSASMTAGVGSSLWMAPEVMVGDRYDEKADIYSFGVVLSEMDTHLLPYAHAREPRDGMRRIPESILLQMVSMGKLHVEFSTSCDGVSQDMVKLAQQCVSREPRARPTAAQVLHRIHLIYRKVGK